MNHNTRITDHTATIDTESPQGYEHAGKQFRHHGHCACGWEGWFPTPEAAQVGLDGHEAVMATILNPEL